MSDGIFPDVEHGGVVIRDGAGAATNPPGVANDYVPDAEFESSDVLRALPSDCTARFDPAQINAIVSELVQLAELWSPDGPWDNSSVDNLKTLFEAWVDGLPWGGDIAAAIAAYAATVTAELNNKVPTSRTISAAGLATGGGNLAANRTITVTEASQVEAEAGVASNVAMTPRRVAQAITVLAPAAVASVNVLKHRLPSASGLLSGEEGIAFHFKSRTAFINDYANTLSASGRPEDLLTVTRATSATYVGRDRLLKTAGNNELRYHHDPETGVPLGILREAFRTNIALWSEEFDNASWQKLSSTVSADNVSWVDGNVVADKIIEAAVTAVHGARQTFTASANTAYTVSVWAKAAERSVFTMLLLSDGANYRAAHFNLAAGTVSDGSTALAGSARIVSYPNGWYRCELTATATASPSGSFIDFRISDTVAPASAGASYLGDGSSGMYFCGAQLEAGAHASSYIKTTSASASRNSDFISIATSLFPVSLTDITLFMRGVPHDADGGGAVQRLAVLQGASLGANSVYLNLSSGAGIAAAGFSGSVSQFSINLGTASDNAEIAAVVAARADDVNARSNLGTGAPDTSASMPAALTTLYIGSDNASQHFSGTVSDVMVATRALTAAEYAALVV